MKIKRNMQKTNKTKQNKNNRAKSTEIPPSSFYVGQLLLGMGPALECSWDPVKTSLEKTDFPMVSGYQL